MALEDFAAAQRSHQEQLKGPGPACLREKAASLNGYEHLKDKSKGFRVGPLVQVSRSGKMWISNRPKRHNQAPNQHDEPDQTAKPEVARQQPVDWVDRELVGP